MKSLTIKSAITLADLNDNIQFLKNKQIVHLNTLETSLESHINKSNNEQPFKDTAAGKHLRPQAYQSIQNTQSGNFVPNIYLLRIMGVRMLKI